MNNLSTYIIEKLKINKNSSIPVNNLEEIQNSLLKIFKDNKCFKENSKEIFDRIKYIYEEEYTWDEDYKDTHKYVICRADYDDYDEYINKFGVNKNLLTVIPMKNIEDILNTYFNKNTQYEKKYTKGKVYLNFYTHYDYIWIDSGLQGDDMHDVLTICILPKFELEEMNLIKDDE